MNPDTRSYRKVNHSPNSYQEGVDYIKLFFLMLSKWRWFAATLVLAFVVAWFYNTYTPPTWRVKTTVLIGEDNSGPSLTDTDQILKGFGLRPGMQNFDNQLKILTSWTLIDQTLNDLPFNIEYFYRRLITKVSLYPESPIQVYTDIGGGFPKDVIFKIKLVDENTYNLTAKPENYPKLNIQAAFGEIIDVYEGSMSIEKTSDSFAQKYASRPVFFVYKSRDKLVESYRSRLKAEPASKEGSIISLSLKGTNKNKDIIFLTRLIDVFVNNNLEQKNQEAERTIRFIEDQLNGISDSLSITEDKLQNFRSKNKVMDISAQGQLIIDQAMKLENERAKLVIESNYYEYLAGYLSKDVAGELPVSPATIGLTDPGLTKLVLELSDLQSQYFSKSMGDKNPMQSQIAQQLYNTRNALSETLKGVRHANDIAMQENSAQIRSVNARATVLPRTERELLGIQREFKLNDVLYSFLLEKNAEAQIQKASNTPDNEVIDYPKPEDEPVLPLPALSYLIALIAGLGFPFLIISTFQSLNNAIKNEDDLLKITDLPIAGHIPHSKNRTEKAVLDEPFSNLAESFRALRSKLQFFTQGIKSPVILITSSMPDEGKSFTSINLASVYSMMGKKTLLAGFDLRKPVYFSDLKIADEKGISTWYIDGALEPIEVSSHLDILPSGPIPPNPAELILSEVTKVLIDRLREKYDYIILDSAPIGTVADSIALARIANATIVVVRYGKTIAPMLTNTISDMNDNGIKGISILINDIQYGKISNRYYGSYKYDNKYFNQAKKNGNILGSWFQKKTAKQTSNRMTLKSKS